MTDKKVNKLDEVDKLGTINFNDVLYPAGREVKLRLEHDREEINQDVFNERMSQNMKWGHQLHSHGRWLAILVEEVGEAAQAMQHDMNSAKDSDADDLYGELIQVAAVASAWAEQVKREKEGVNILE